MEFKDKLKTGDILIWKRDNYFNLGKLRSALFVRVWDKPYVVTIKCNQYTLVSWNDFCEEGKVIKAYRNPYKVLEETCAKKIFSYLEEPELEEGLPQALYKIQIQSDVDHLIGYCDYCGWRCIVNIES